MSACAAAHLRERTASLGFLFRCRGGGTRRRPRPPLPSALRCSVSGLWHIFDTRRRLCRLAGSHLLGRTSPPKPKRGRPWAAPFACRSGGCWSRPLLALNVRHRRPQETREQERAPVPGPAGGVDPSAGVRLITDRRRGCGHKAPRRGFRLRSGGRSNRASRHSANSSPYRRSPRASRHRARSHPKVSARPD